MKNVLKATGLMGSSALVKLLAGVVSAKVVALLLGPGGISAFAQFQYVLAIAMLIGALGMNTSIVREIGRAEATNDAVALGKIRVTAVLVATLLSILIGVLILIFRDAVAVLALGDATLKPYLGWLACAIPPATITTIQLALLNGLRQIKDMARVTVLSSIASLVATVALVWLMGTPGLIVCLIVGPLVSVWLSERRLRPALLQRGAAVNCFRLARYVDLTIVRDLVVLGGTVMVTALLAQGTQFAARVWLLNHLGTAANGQFQAAWTISIGYMSLVLYAMAADYYPRLVQAQGDPEQISLTINQQLRAALLLIAPLAIGILAFSHPVVYLLYSGEFTATSAILRWQLIGDLLKAISWAFGFVLLAAGRSMAYFLVEVLWNVLFLLGLIFLVPRYGLVATGSTFLASYAVYAAVTYALAVRTSGYKISREVLVPLGIFGILIAVLSFTNGLTASATRTALSIVIVVLAAGYSAWTLEHDVKLISGIATRLRAHRTAPMMSKDSV